MNRCEDISCNKNDCGRCNIELDGGSVTWCMDEDGRKFCSGYSNIKEVDLESFEGGLDDLFDKVY